MKSSHKKKGQILTQVFVYIIAIVISGLVLLYGYSAIKNFAAQQKLIAIAELKTHLENDVKTTTSAVKIREYKIPEYFNEVCFVDLSKAAVDTGHPIVNDSWQAKIEKNTFLIKNLAKESFYIGKIEIKNEYLCLNVTNKKIKLRLEGKGDRVKISSAR